MASQVELLPPVGATSKAWDYFGFPAKDGMHEIFKNFCIIYFIITGKFIEPNKKERKLVYCKLCPKELKYCGNTTNLRNHLEGSHAQCRVQIGAAI